MRLVVCVLPLVLLADLTFAETQRVPGAVRAGSPLTAEEFDALTRGTVMDTFSGDSIYGIEKFFSGRRSIWEDADGCMYGTWAQVGEQICFTYEDDPANPDCWTYFKQGNKIIGYFEGDQANEPISLVQSKTGLTCDEYIGV
jgi:hypothetical protein